MHDVNGSVQKIEVAQLGKQGDTVSTHKELSQAGAFLCGVVLNTQLNQ